MKESKRQEKKIIKLIIEKINKASLVKLFDILNYIEENWDEGSKKNENEKEFRKALAKSDKEVKKAVDKSNKKEKELYGIL